MHIRTFKAANLNAALSMIRDQMGPDAAVLHTREVSSGMWRFLGRTTIEVTAGLKHQPKPTKKPFILTPTYSQPSIQSSTIHHSPRIAEPIRLSPSGRRIVALIGATGVGKTTTIAKLAGQFRLQQKARIGFLTIDAFRAAAIEQLQAFAGALRAPLEVVRTVGEVEESLDRLADVDLVMVDTLGLSPRGDARLKYLSTLLDAIRPDETHLLLDANNSASSAIDCVRAFSIFSPTAAILSKVDEVRCAEGSIMAATDGGLRFNYLTTGQSVPGDIKLATVAELQDYRQSLQKAS